MSRNPFKQKAFEKMSAIEFKMEKRLAHLQYVNGVAVNSEDDLCISLVTWWDRIYPERKFDLIHIPNEGKRSTLYGKRMRDMGLRAGSPDYAVFNKGQFVGWIEVKFGRNDLTLDQRDFYQYCRDNNINYAKVYTFQDFKDTLQDWGIYDPQRDKVPIFKTFGGCQISRAEAEKLFKKTGLKINNESIGHSPAQKVLSPFKDTKDE